MESLGKESRGKKSLGCFFLYICFRKQTFFKVNALKLFSKVN